MSEEARRQTQQQVLSEKRDRINQNLANIRQKQELRRVNNKLVNPIVLKVLE